MQETKLSIEDGIALINLARQAIESFFSKIPLEKTDKFKEKRGVFVTLTRFDQLRGCIGFPQPAYPLDKAIVESARSAAFRDPRFMPVEEDELPEIGIEISVLTVPALIEVKAPEEYLGKIIIGRHGLIIKKDYHSGLLLPQVFAEHGCTPQDALEMTCEKAGLDKDDWKEPDAEVYSFEAQIFCEEEPKGKVIQK